MFRTRAWNVEVARQLQKDKAYARLFIQKLLRDGEDPNDVIRHVVRAYGIKELALRVHVQPQNIARILRAPARAKDSTLKRLLQPFGVKVERRLALV